MTGKLRRGAVAVTLAAGTLFGGVGVGHALAATTSAASPSVSPGSRASSGSPSSSSSNRSATHHCPNDSSSSGS